MIANPTPAQYPKDEVFVERFACIACGGGHLETLANGRFADEPLRSFIEDDPWGECPLPYIEHEPWEFVRCQACEQKFHKRILSPAWQHVLFTQWMTDAAIRHFEELHGVNKPGVVFQKTQDAVRHVLRIQKMTRDLRLEEEPLRILDFGCGWGRFLAVASLFGAEAYGIDKDQDRQRGAEDLGVHVKHSLDELDPSLKGNLHAITLFQVLEHLEHPAAELEELRQWLQPGGILVLETPNCEGIMGIRSPQEYRGINPLSHINAFTPKTLRSIAERLGFRLVAPAAAHCTSEAKSVAKTEVKRGLGALPNNPVSGRLLYNSTDLYFRLEKQPLR